MTNETTCHPEPSAAESKDPAALPISLATEFLDCARNDSLGRSSSELRISFVIRHSRFVISSS
jgi:hypothetical protein